MTDTTKGDIIEQIDVSVKSGFYDKEEILTHVEDYMYEIPFDHEWTKQQIEKAYSDRLKEQSTWSAVTDFDKLVLAFDKLNSSGIIALHNAGVTKQDGEGDSEEIHEDLLSQPLHLFNEGHEIPVASNEYRRMVIPSKGVAQHVFR